MYLSAVFLTAAFLVSSSTASLLDKALFARQTNSEEAYLSQVCFPNTTDPVPPCQEIINIQSACQPNGTSRLDILAHAQCMCGGGFFSNWVGCLNCDYVHGGRSQQIVDTFNIIITSASHILCTGTPLAPFASIFSSLTDINAAGAQATGATFTSDLYPSNTAISLYYTPSGPQGLGAITGSETAATASPTGAGGGSGAKNSASAAKTTGDATNGAIPSKSSSSSSTSTSKAGAAQTNVMRGVLGLVAGGVVMAAL